MINFIRQLEQRNSLLFWFGLYNFIIAITCLLLMPFDHAQVLGVSRWLKPMKFYFAVGIMTWSMGWYLYYLDNTIKVRRYSWLIASTMFFENGFILMQAFRKTTSHFNNSTSFNSITFSLMGIMILIFTVTCIFITVTFFRQRQFAIPAPYLWGIRLGLVFFVLFSLEGGMMLSLLKHTIGGPDGGPGIPVMNWSKYQGDLRTAHFFGIHSLQILQLLGFYVAKTKKRLVFFSIVYFVIVAGVFVQALAGIPLFF